MSVNDGNNRESSAEIVKCETCGADLVFSANSGKLECPYCDNEVAIEVTQSNDRDYFLYENKGDVDTIGLEFKCPNCHADIIFDDMKTAFPCPFCGATCIADPNATPGIKPDSLLPFAVDKETAAEQGKKWAKKRLFAPSKFKKTFEIDNMQGLYAPSFAFTADTYSRYKGRLGEKYTVTVGSGNNKRTETRIKWYNVSGSFSKVYYNTVIESSSHLDQKQMDKVGPFDMENAVAFKKEFLAGFTAEKYDNSIKNCFGIAKNRYAADIRRCILSKYNADVVDYLNIDTSYRAVRFKHILMPLWVCGSMFKNKLYNFFINGRSGRSYGKAPVSPVRVTIAALLGVGVIVGLYFLVKYIGG